MFIQNGMSYTSGAWIKLLSYLVHISSEAACCIEREILVLNGGWLLSYLNLFFLYENFLTEYLFSISSLNVIYPSLNKGIT